MSGSTDFKGIIGHVARELLGKPTQENKRELRFGTHGSMSIDLEKDTFYDHENKEGGGVLDLVARQTGSANGEAIDWLKARGLLPDDDNHESRYKGAIYQAFHNTYRLAEPAGQATRARGTLKEAYVYTDQFGENNRRANRYENPKGFSQEGWTGTGWRNGKDACKGLPVYPYRLQEIFTALTPCTIFICEGEKDCDRLARLGCFATTNPMGAGKWVAELNQWFEGWDCFILADNDEAGHKHAQDVARNLKPVAHSVRVVQLPGLPEKGDVSDWLDANDNDEDELVRICKVAPLWGAGIATVDFHTLLTEEVVEEPDYIEPDLLGPGNFFLIAGPPKAQKSYFLQETLVACATGSSFLGGLFKVPRPLRVFCLQAEMNRKLLRKRARAFKLLSPEHKALLKTNLVFSERFNMVLNDDGVRIAIETIKGAFPDEPPDIIAVDPLANVFDGDNENDNTQIMRFLQGKLESIRRLVNPLAALMLVHHSTKKTSEDMARDPFVAIRGGGSLRGYYDSCAVIFKKAEGNNTRCIHFELRGGESPPPIEVELVDGRFQKVDSGSLPSKETCRLILARLDQEWKRGMPWSPHERAGSEGRYAVRNIAGEFDVTTESASLLIDLWMKESVLTFRERVYRKHPSGFEVTGQIA